MADAKPPSKPYARLESWIWILIYGGMFAVILGLVAGRVNEPLGWAMAVPGVVLAVTGVVLIYVRSRLGAGKNSGQ
ncbi:hypothetical protein QTH87_12460 [Variovorax sp. J22P168]|uniref:hypothetical protein n=1 Tax=Variovorax jilinensis TaxID=3053513 RepID=UPI002575F9B4|nr:hypothetical protein [Variovorax sp. J22P168]MDM0013247.1 hypothetical protein [Variovorax sp. J22P168]